MKLSVSVDLRWRTWAWPPVDMGSLSKTDIAGAEVEGGLARTLGATVGLVGVINLQEAHNWICASTTGNINTSCKRRFDWALLLELESFCEPVLASMRQLAQNRHSWNRHCIWYITPSYVRPSMDTRLFRVIDGIVSVFLGCVNLTCRTSHLNDSKWITLTCGHN